MAMTRIFDEFFDGANLKEIPDLKKQRRVRDAAGSMVCGTPAGHGGAGQPCKEGRVYRQGSVNPDPRALRHQ